MCRRVILLSICLLLAGVIAGCASADKYFRTERSSFVSASGLSSYKKAREQPGIDKDLAASVDLRCLDADGSVVSPSDTSQCLYIALDVSKLYSSFGFNPIGKTETELATLAQRRQVLMDVVYGVSERNCDTFLSRAFAQKSVSDAVVGTGRDIATGISAAAANASPHAAAGLNLANLLAGSINNNVNTAYYLDKTFSSFKNSVMTGREEKQRDLTACLAKPYLQCSILVALTYQEKVDDVCSIEGGTNKLRNLVDNAISNRTVNERLNALSTEIGTVVSGIQNNSNQQEALKNLQKQVEELGKFVSQSSAVEQKLENIRQSIQSAIPMKSAKPDATVNTPPVESAKSADKADK